MITFSQLLDKQLVDKDTAMSFGRVTNLALDNTTAILVCCDTYITVDKILSIDSVIIASRCAVANTTPPTLIGKNAFTTKGCPLGKVCDIQLTSTMCGKKIQTPEHEISMGKVLEIADVVLTKKLPTPKSTTTTPIQYGNCDWLLGRICYKNITNYNNEIIVHNGQLISRATINTCKSAYKLRELIVNSR